MWKSVPSSVFIALFLFMSYFSSGKSAKQLPEKVSYERPLLFIENMGQVLDQYRNTREDIDFKVSGDPGLNIFIGNGAIHYQFNEPTNKKQPIPVDRTKSSFVIPPATSFAMYRMDVELVGCNGNCKVIAEDKQDYHENYITKGIGEKGVVAGSFKRIVYKDIYPNIDWVLTIAGGQLKHEFVVRKGGKVSSINIRYGGAEKLAINEDGSFTASTPMGAITEQAPKCYDQHGEITSKFVLEGNSIKYSVGHYMGTLVIDPPLIWTATYGGTGEDVVQSIATDASYGVYMGGYTNSVASFATTGAFSTTYGGGSRDAVLLKYNSIGVLQWATYYGGFGYDVAFCVATDPTGNVYLGGATDAPSGMSTSSAHQPAYGGGSFDGFLAKFDGTGAQLWATYYGGTSSEDITGVATDAAGNVYIAGRTSSTNAISTVGCFKPTLSGIQDCYLAKFNSAGVRQWATYYGGSDQEGFTAVATDNTGGIVIAGSTWSTDGIATTVAHQVVHGGGTIDAFLAKFDNTGARLWGTYYGGTDYDGANTVTADATGNIYVAGTTLSTASIATPGAHQTTLGGGGVYDAFVTKFDGSGVLQWGTYYGGNGYDDPTGIAIESSGNIAVGGWTSSPIGISTPGSYQPSLSGVMHNAFLAEFTPTGGLPWATYYGPLPTTNYEGYGVATDGDGSMYLGGTATISDPKTLIVKFSTCTVPVAGPFTGGSTVCVGNTLTLTAPTTGGTWSSSGSAATIGSSTGILSGVSTGTTTVSYAVANTCAARSATQVVTVITLPVAGTISGADTVCVGSTITLSGSVSGGTWSASNGNATVSGTSVTGVAAGSVTITHTLNNSCGSAEAYKSVYVSDECHTGINDIATSATTVQPNPAENSITIRSAEKIRNISIVNTIGQQILSEEYDRNEVILSIANLPVGVYLLRVNNGKARRLIKQ